MDIGWRLIFGLGLAVVGVAWIVRREVPIGIEGRPPSFHARGLWAVILGTVAVAIGVIVAFDIL